MASVVHVIVTPTPFTHSYTLDSFSLLVLSLLLLCLTGHMLPTLVDVSLLYVCLFTYKFEYSSIFINILTI